MNKSAHNSSKDKDDLSTDYIIKLLENDARKLTKKLSPNNSYGGSSDRESNGLKPNTRFLKNLIKQSDSHNRALLEKEKELARRKLEDKIEGNLHSTHNKERTKKRRDSDAEYYGSKNKRTKFHQDSEYDTDKPKLTDPYKSRRRSKNRLEHNPVQKDKIYDFNDSKIQSRDNEKKDRFSRTTHREKVKINHFQEEEDSDKIQNKHSRKESTRNTKIYQKPASENSSNEETSSQAIVKKGRGLNVNNDKKVSHLESARIENPQKDYGQPDRSKKILDSLNSRLQWASSSDCKPIANSHVKREPLRRAEDSELSEYYRKREEIDWDDFDKPGTIREWDKSKIVDKNGYIHNFSGSDKWK